MSDEQYDRLAMGVADRWDRLDPFLQWQLGSADAIRATGFHIKVTKMGEHAAIAWYQSRCNSLPHGDAIKDWRYSKNGQVHWVTVGT